MKNIDSRTNLWYLLITDLYGLLLFLGVDPYWVQPWWNKLVYEPFCYGVTEPMYKLLTSVMWRTMKTDVLDQVCKEIFHLMMPSFSDPSEEKKL